MKTLCFLFSLLLGSSFGQAQNTVRVTVGPFNGLRGIAFIGLYNRADTFGKPDQVWQGQQIPVKARTVECVFRDVPNGTYAIAVFQDENGNRKLDKGLFGLPKEHYGFSTNVRPATRPATFEEAQFTLTGQSLALTIPLN